SAASYKIPSTVYVVGINGQANSLSATATGTLPGVGAVQDVVALGGFTTGTNGYLTLLEKSSPFNNSSAVISAGQTSVNTSSTGVGFGNGGTTSPYFGTNGVHAGGGIGSLSDLEAASVSYLLIQTPTAPVIGNSIDGGSTASATVAGGAIYAGWNVL